MFIIILKFHEFQWSLFVVIVPSYTTAFKGLYSRDKESLSIKNVL